MALYLFTFLPGSHGPLNELRHLFTAEIAESTEVPERGSVAPTSPCGPEAEPEVS